ncbi:Rieske (2Fe-2S) protein [Mycobacterium avium]|uniref:Rieske (2Fe-2S) protein n=1 Tax=Mycobacterium avium TaxID=1764 RepID=UPI0007A0CE82|nr:Rieske (2Fe-2S) protein [Mycobacterium avium]MBZ4584990.1 Rieske (2Fe-2S) protein [Mycobacterium avium subsp. hominissuis]MBZ4616369.1 Rieske (2Fe-2S) protein [Mycobacterium avium subsp. hominissuis]MDV3244976.1 Rieske (2Fe-2S) protein [Mycobacterium avium subsp. hominissuis]MDV3273126.1 Rieske (2Fe-2S) protein [Mycobacterium avium subsp. hominissuis]MDV3302601.1 Rieske (2Fe-2S) protein [Mycobacterium avium subsp. hominissuis]
MNARGLRRYVDDLLRGRRPRPFLPDDFEAAQLRTAIELRAARPDSEVADAPRPEFLADLHRRLAEQMSGAPTRPRPGRGSTRRQVIVGTSAAATAAVAAVSIDRTVIAGQSGPDRAPQIASGTLAPNQGSWQRVAASSEVPDGVLRAFDLGAVSGFVRRVDGKVQAISGVCTHQGCKLWFDAPDDTLRCPCHTTSFSPSGQVLTHQLPIEPKPLPALMVREADGIIEVFAPVRRT